MSKKKRRLHPLELAEKNASFDILRYIRKKYKEALIKRATWNCQTAKQRIERIERIKRIDTNYGFIILYFVACIYHSTCGIHEKVTIN